MNPLINSPQNRLENNYSSEEESLSREGSGGRRGDVTERRVNRLSSSLKRPAAPRTAESESESREEGMEGRKNSRRGNLILYKLTLLSQRKWKVGRHIITSVDRFGELYNVYDTNGLGKKEEKVEKVDREKKENKKAKPISHNTKQKPPRQQSII